MFFIGFLKTVVTSFVSARAENQICEKAGCRYSYSICWNGCTVFDNEGGKRNFLWKLAPGAGILAGHYVGVSDMTSPP